MVPSLPLWLGWPEIPRFALQLRVGAHVSQDRRVGNVFDQARPEHRRGDAEDQIPELLHLREVRLRHLATGRVASTGDGEEVVHPAVGSLRQRPLDVTMNGKRASRTGPSGVTKNGILLLAPSIVATAICGFAPRWGYSFKPGLDPPGPGCAWQLPQLFELKPGPRPASGSPARVPPTESIARKRTIPS